MNKHLSNVVNSLKTDLDQYRQDAISTAEADLQTGCAPHDPSQNEWVLQIAEIYKAAYGEELDTEHLIVD